MEQLGNPVTTTVSVFTRHSKDCPQTNPQWKRCKCRKSLYICHGGKIALVSAKTRSWEQAELAAQVERDKRDPIKQRHRELDAQIKQVAQEQAAAVARQITVADALKEWIASKKITSASTAELHTIFSRKFQSWATENDIEFLHLITRRMLSAWRSEWSPEAKRKYDRMAPGTQEQFRSRIQQFFRRAILNEIIGKDPSVVLDRIKFQSEKTMPLTSEQFDLVVAATYLYDRDRKREGQRVGSWLRALFLAMRWSGLRISDVLMLPKVGVHNGRLTLVTQKSKKEYDYPLAEPAVTALLELPLRKGIHPDYFFWSTCCSPQNLKGNWTPAIKELNRYLKLTNDKGEPMAFRSHMLRDTFAVELLLQGVDIEKVSRLLTHSSVRTTEKYYAHWVKSRQADLEDAFVIALRKMGAMVAG